YFRPSNPPGAVPTGRAERRAGMKIISSTKGRLILITALATGMLIALMSLAQKTSADPKGALLVQAEAGQGRADVGNSEPAKLAGFRC
ncbi:MAG TPA: hypothetical protein VLG74_12900, partial [Blastocatellia bacterium]|nr:hypothetical protein [Blastocatellia bacterium]